MKYVLYIDVFFAVNFFMDLLILVIANRLIKPQTTKIRLFIASMTGATLSCIVIVLIKNQLLQRIFTYLLIALVMTLVGYGKGKVRMLVGRIAVVYAVTFIMAGIINGLYYFTNISMYIRHLNIYIFISITVPGYFITDYIINYVSKHMKNSSNRNDIYNVIIYLCDRKVSVKGLYDSGNSLMEPIENVPVHIVQKDAVDEILEGVEITQVKIRIVPFKAIGTKVGILKAIETNKIVIETKSGEIELKNAMIGIYEGELSHSGKYNMILNRSIKQWL